MKDERQTPVEEQDWKVPEWTDVRELCDYEGACLSIYLGSHQRGGGTVATASRLRSLLPDLDEELVRRGVLAPDRDSLLAPIRTLSKDAALEKGHEGGLAIFRSPHMLRIYRLPWPVAECWYLQGRLFLRPLWEMLVENRNFLVLALARKRIRLLEWSSGVTREVPLPSDVPDNLADFGAFEQPDHELINQSSAGPSVGRMSGVMFGTGASRDREYHQLHNFHKAIDRGLHSLLYSLHLPLVLAGTESDVASYMKINTYPRIARDAVSGSPDGGWTDEELTGLARHIMRRWSPEKEQRALSQMGRAAHREKSTETNRIVVSAETGRILHLFVAAGATEQRGNLDRITGRLLLTGEFRSSDDDLINAAMVETARHEGNVWVLAPERMPERVSAAALFRY